MTSLKTAGSIQLFPFSWDVSLSSSASGPAEKMLFTFFLYLLSENPALFTKRNAIPAL